MKSFDMNQAVEYSYYVCCLLANIKQSLQYQIIQQYFQCQMNFNYQLYVNRMNYEPYQWPPDISLAELHSRVSQQGPINQNGVKCPCCQYQSKKKFTKWLGRDINEDCSNLGSAVPAFFGLLKFYISAIFTAILINGIYPLWAMNFTCENYNLAGKDSCLKIIFFYYIDFDIELSLLVQNGRLDIAQNLVILETITYYLLILVNLGSLWYLFYMEKKEEGLVLQHTQAARNALIIGNVPQVDPQKLKQKINLQTKLQIIEIIRLKDVKKYYELFNKRNGIYYNLLSKYVESEDPKQQKKLNKTLSTLHQQLKQQKKRLAKEDFNHLLIIFKTSYMATVVHNHYTLTQFQKLRQGTKLLIEELGFSKQWSQLPLYTLKVPSVKQIKWQNVGENLKKKLVGRIKSFITAFGIIILLMFFFEEPLRYSLETHTQDPKKLSIAQKFIPVIVSFGLFAVSVVFRNYMVEISKRKNPLNQYEAAKFVLLSSMLFHIVFYIIIPVAFFSINDGIDATIKLYVISDQARTFIVMQLILCIIDIPFQVWRRRKTKCLADQRQGFKYNQQMLHKIVQYRDFPLEMRLQVMFRIWSLAMFYSFYLPYILYYMLIALIILYVLEKRNFYLHYTLRRSITLKLQKSFLVFFVNFFCIFQCYSYCFSTRSNRQFDWGMYTAAPITFTLLVLNFVFWIIVQPYLRKQKQKQSQQLMQKLLDEKPDKQRDAYLMNWAKDISSGYREGYDRFLSSINNQKLDDQIQDYLQSLSGDHHQTQGMQVQKIIEMAESQFDDALND